MDKLFFRYEAVEYAEIGIDGDFQAPLFPSPKINLITLNLHKETLKGYWIGYGKIDELHSRGRWVSKTSKKRYAYPTKEEALVNFIKRNETRVKILKRQLMVCEISIMKAREITEDTVSR